MLEKMIELTNEYIESMPKKERKKYGQFFTSMETARFMAALYNIDEKKSRVSVLDAGAGSGILSCAFIERLEMIDSIQEIELTCYENDNNVLPLLKQNLEYCKEKSGNPRFSGRHLSNCRRGGGLSQRCHGRRVCRLRRFHHAGSDGTL